MVDFPPPEGPTMETFVPGATSKDRLLKILTFGRVGYANATGMSDDREKRANHSQT